MPNGASEGVEQRFRVWMGIHTGFCNVGNFGSAYRIYYTIIGAEAEPCRAAAVDRPTPPARSSSATSCIRSGAGDVRRQLAARDPDERHQPRDRALRRGRPDRRESAQRAQVISEHGKGLDLFIDLDVLDDNAAERTKQRLKGAAGCAGATAEAGVTVLR